MEPFFSVIVPNYNNSKYIHRCIKSVIDQTFQNWELLIIDNNSNDNSLDVVNSFNDKRVKILTINNSGIIAKSRNLGINSSKGIWLCFLDSDDWWEESKLNIIYKKIIKTKVDVIVHNEFLFTEESKKKKKLNYGPFEKNFFEKLLLYGNRISVSASSVKKKFIVENEINFSEKAEHVTAEDYDFWLKISKNNGIFSFIKNYLGYYYIHQNNYSSNLSTHFENIFNVCEYHSQSYKHNKFIKYIRARKNLYLLIKNFGKIKMLTYLKLLVKNSFIYIFLIFYNKIKIKILR